MLFRRDLAISRVFITITLIICNRLFPAELATGKVTCSLLCCGLVVKEKLMLCCFFFNFKWLAYIMLEVMVCKAANNN